LTLLGKLLLGATGIAAVVILFLVLRPDDDSDETAVTPAATTTETTTQAETGTETNEEPTTTEPEEEPEEPAGPRIIRLNVRADEPEIERVDVDLDERVVLVVRADVADHVHLHGYDIMSDVAPGQPARIAFRATIPGQFEVELEDRRQQIAQLTVQ
jgi:hypothetical protein